MFQILFFFFLLKKSFLLLSFIKNEILNFVGILQNLKSESDEGMKEPLPTIDEDTSNEAYTQRHEKALNEERKRFTTFLKFPYSTR